MAYASGRGGLLPRRLADVYEESGLTFRFDADAWVVRRYDAHPFYRVLSGRGYRGVDFLLLHRREPRAVWLEVKHYVRADGGGPGDTLRELLADPSGLARHLAEKQADTLRGLRQIDHHYRTRWWWRLVGGRLLRHARRGTLRVRARLRRSDAVLFPLLREFSEPGASDRATRFVTVLELPPAGAQGKTIDADAVRGAVAEHLLRLGLPDAEVCTHAELPELLRSDGARAGGGLVPGGATS